MSTTGYTQTHDYISISTPLGKDKLLLRGFRGEEGIAELFHFTLDMVSEHDDLDAKGIIGKTATVSIVHGEGKKRYINGTVTRFVQGGSGPKFTTYHAELRPFLWMLTLTRDSRIFQNQTVPEIIEKVFKDAGLSDYRNALKRSYSPAREYCVQYQESAFAFVSRLMEDEGIFYFFEHEDGKHTIVLADDISIHTPCEGAEKARYGPRRSGEPWIHDEVVTNVAREHRVVTGKYQMDDFDFETPTTDLKVNAEGESGKQMIYEYPGGFTKKDIGDDKVSRRIEMQQHGEVTLRGEGTLRALTPGYKFSLQDHPSNSFNADYVLRSVSHNAGPDHYTNSFEAFPDSVPFRPALQTPKPFIAGTQTAIVVGKKGEEIWTDKYGRIKVQFHWDQEGKKDENSSCWIRVDQSWAGKKWGGLFLPRIDQEVVVSFLEGDPDRPLVVGAVYNSQQTVPYALPSNQTKSTLKSNSSKGGGGFNEIRFEDKKDSEEIFVHAQKDRNIEVENDQTTTIKQNRTATIEEADETLIVEKGNRTVKVNTGNETHEVKGTRDLTVTGNETHTDEADFTQEVTGNHTLKVTGDLLIDVSGKVTIKAGSTLTSEAGTSLTNKAGTSLTNKAGTSLTNDAGASLTNKGGASLKNEAPSITSKASGMHNVESGGILALKGSLVKLN